MIAQLVKQAMDALSRACRVEVPDMGRLVGQIADAFDPERARATDAARAIETFSGLTDADRAAMRVLRQHQRRAPDMRGASVRLGEDDPGCRNYLEYVYGRLTWEIGMGAVVLNAVNASLAGTAGGVPGVILGPLGGTLAASGASLVGSSVGYMAAIARKRDEFTTDPMRACDKCRENIRTVQEYWNRLAENTVTRAAFATAIRLFGNYILPGTGTAVSTGISLARTSYESLEWLVSGAALALESQFGLDTYTAYWNVLMRARNHTQGSDGGCACSCELVRNACRCWRFGDNAAAILYALLAIPLRFPIVRRPGDREDAEEHDMGVYLGLGPGAFVVPSYIMDHSLVDHSLVLMGYFTMVTTFIEQSDPTLPRIVWL